ncbi:MAG: DUF2256 domain-containing protein [Rhodobacteraceae bacterium]|nr:DUF2256 domain-containing protein [Paracoccaceae bacterium]
MHAKNLYGLWGLFDWRDKWAKIWDEMRYCSDRYRRYRREKRHIKT